MKRFNGYILILEKLKELRQSCSYWKLSYWIDTESSNITDNLVFNAKEWTPLDNLAFFKAENFVWKKLRDFLVGSTLVNF